MDDINQQLTDLTQTLKESNTVFLELGGPYASFLAEQKRITDETIKNNQRVTDAIEETTTDAQIKERKRKELYEKLLKERNQSLDLYGKEIDNNVKLSKAQQNYLNALDEQLDKQEQLIQASANPVKALRDISSSTNSLGGILGKLEDDVFKTVGKRLGIGGVASMQLLVDAGKGFLQGIGAMTESIYKGERGAQVGFKGAKALSDAITKSLYGISGALLALPLGPALKIVGVGIAATSAAIQGFTKLLEMASEVNDKLYNSYNKLSQVGATTAKGMTGLFNTIQRVGLTTAEVEKFNTLITEGSKNLALFGGSVTKGVEFYTDVAEKIAAPESKINKELMLLGITADQQREGTMKFMAEESRLGLLKNKDVEYATKGAKNYLEKLDRITMLTGATRKEQEDARNAIMANDELRAAIFEAEQDDTDEGRKRLAKLKRAYEAASMLQLQGDVAGATGVAKYAAAGGIADKESAVAYQTFGGKGGLLEKIETGGDETEMAQAISRGYKRQLNMIGPTVAIAGFQAGSDYITSRVGKAVDYVASSSEILEKAKSEGLTPSEYLEKLQKARKETADDVTNKNVEAQRIQQEAAKNIDKAAFKMLNGPGGAIVLQKASSTMDTTVKLFRSIFKLDKTPEPKETAETKQEPPTKTAAPAKEKETATKPVPPTTEAAKKEEKKTEAKPAAAETKKEESKPAAAPTTPTQTPPATPVAAKKEEAKTTAQPVRVGMEFSENQTKDMVMRHEGVRYEPYKDTKGLWTVGVGHLIGNGRTLPEEYNRKFTHQEVMDLFDKDFQHHKQAAQTNVPKFSNLSSPGQAAMIDLTFNMGPNWISKWPNLKKQLNEGDIEGAATNLESSDWYKQVRSRGPTVVNLVKNSVIQQAQTGGYFDGPKEGYFVELHGKEFVGNEKHIEQIKKLIDIAESNNLLKDESPEVAETEMETDDDELTADILIDFTTMLESKIDELTEKFRVGNSTDESLLNYSR